MLFTRLISKINNR